MKLIDEIKSIKCGDKELRDFGFVVGGILSAIGLFILYRGKAHGIYFIYVGAPLILLGWLKPKWLKQLNIAWMSLGLIMGAIVAPVIIALLYYLGVTTVSLVARLFRHQFLDLSVRTKADTYWIPKDNSKKDKASYEKQF